MASVKSPEKRFWRTDLRKGRNIYALLTNDPERPSENDQLVGVMETSAMAEDVVHTHNVLLERYGPRYPGIIEAELREMS